MGEGEQEAVYKCNICKREISTLTTDPSGAKEKKVYCRARYNDSGVEHICPGILVFWKFKKKKYDKKEEQEPLVKPFTKTFADVIGLENVKEELKDEVIIRTTDKKAADECNIELGSGFIIAGLSGIGKTMLSKALPNEPEFKGHMEFYGEFFVKDFTGSSQEDTSKKVTEFFDKIELCAIERGKTQIAHIHEIEGILRNDRNSVINDARLNSFLAKTGIDNGNYIIIGTTNRPYLIPFPIIRRGRFKSLFAEGPSEHEVYLLLNKYISELKMQRFSDDDLHSFAKNMYGYTGSDIQGIKTDIFKWYKRSIRKGILSKDYIMTKEDFGQFLHVDSERRLNVQNKIKEYVEKAESGEEEISSKSRRQDSDVLLPSQIKELVNKAHPTVRDLVPSECNPHFNKHKDKTIGEIAIVDFSYIKWLAKDVYELPGIAARTLIEGKGEPLVDKCFICKKPVTDGNMFMGRPVHRTCIDKQENEANKIREDESKIEKKVEKKVEPKVERLPIFEYPKYWYDKETGDEGSSQKTIKFLTTFDIDEDLAKIATKNKYGKYDNKVALYSATIEENTFEKNKGKKYKIIFTGNDVYVLADTIKETIPGWTTEDDSDFTALKDLSVVVTDDFDGIRFSVIEDDIYKKLCNVYAKLKIMNGNK